MKRYMSAWQLLMVVFIISVISGTVFGMFEVSTDGKGRFDYTVTGLTSEFSIVSIEFSWGIDRGVYDVITPTGWEFVLSESSILLYADGPDNYLGPKEQMQIVIHSTFTQLSVGFSRPKVEYYPEPGPTRPPPGVQIPAPKEPVPPPVQIADILDFIDESVANGTLVGEGSGNSADKKLNALINMFEATNDLIVGGYYEDACGQLTDILKKCDGQIPPPDFVSGEAVEELVDRILLLMEDIGCE